VSDLLACLPATIAELIEMTGEDYATILAALRELRDQGAVTTTRQGRSIIWMEA
jgi:DNA-binding transcriptional ArsR family regulator